MDVEVVPVEVDVLRDLERSRDDWPISQCSVKSASGEEDPGFVVPNAQIILSVPMVLTYKRQKCKYPGWNAEEFRTDGHGERELWLRSCHLHYGKAGRSDVVLDA